MTFQEDVDFNTELSLRCLSGRSVRDFSVLPITSKTLLLLLFCKVTLLVHESTVVSWGVQSLF